ncbi:MAG TPA: SDR family oxidoreductase [Candidatus Saccharimonadales bacterium]|nr:SDR family oxidoreductase [Candidatus Saccharimonadales bacterium]
MSLKGKVVVVTGSSKGIGFEIAKEFSEKKKAHVVVCSRSLERSVMAASKINGSTLALELDVTSDSSINKFIDCIMKKYNRIDILVNNSGYPFDKSIWDKKLHEGTTEELLKILDVDLVGAVRLSRAVIPVMLKHDNNESGQSIITNRNKLETIGLDYEEGEAEQSSDIAIAIADQKVYDRPRNGGVIITISSTPALSGRRGGFPYTIAKAGNISLTKCIAKEYGDQNIRAYSLALGNIATKATYEAITEAVRTEAAQEAPMKRWGNPLEVAKVATCIADDNFSYATGNTIVVDGGTVIL